MPLAKTTSYGYQATIIEATKDARYFGLFIEHGTGTTHVTKTMAERQPWLP